MKLTVVAVRQYGSLYITTLRENPGLDVHDVVSQLPRASRNRVYCAVYIMQLHYVDSKMFRLEDVVFT